MRRFLVEVPQPDEAAAAGAAAPAGAGAAAARAAGAARGTRGTWGHRGRGFGRRRLIAASGAADGPPAQLVATQAATEAGLTPHQAQVLDLVNARRHVFLTGCAGCGKTRTALALRDGLRAAGTPFELAASTGVAAELLGGCTLHSLLCLGRDVGDTPEARAALVARARRYRRVRIKKMQVLLIDEVSMLSAETLEVALHILRAVRAPAALPVIVLVGDFLQLAPVTGALALDSAPWTDLAPAVVCLQRSFRQAGDADFLQVLNEVRVGRLSPGSIEALQSRVGVTVDEDAPVQPTVLQGTRAAVDAVNARHLQALPGPSVTLAASIFVGRRATNAEAWLPLPGSRPVPPGRLQDGLAGTEVSVPPGMGLDAMVTEAKGIAAACLTTTPAVLELRVGAQVMFTANLGPGIANGTRGVVVDFVGGLPQVQLASGACIVPMPVARVRRLEAPIPGFHPATGADGADDDDDVDEDDTGQPVDALETGPALVCSQVPLALAWALTIHKSQGCTLTLADISLRVFAEGQAYVALSRAPSLDAITLRDFNPAIIKADPRVVAWYEAEAAKAPPLAPDTAAP